MTTDTAPAAQPSDHAPVKSVPVATPVAANPEAEPTEVSSPAHNDAEKLYQQYLHPEATQVVKDNGKPFIDLGPLPNHDAVADTLQDTKANPLGPTLVPFLEDENFALVQDMRGPKLIVKPKAPPKDPKTPPKDPKTLPVTVSPTISRPPKPTSSGPAVAPIHRSSRVPLEISESYDFLSNDTGENNIVIESIADSIAKVEPPVINKPVTGTVASTEDHHIIGMEQRRAEKLSLCSYILMKTFPCEITAISLDKDVVRATGVDLFDGQIYQGTWDRNETVPILNIIETRYTLDGIQGNTLTLKAANSLTSQIDIHDEDLKAAMDSALKDHRTVSLLHSFGLVWH